MSGTGAIRQLSLAWHLSRRQECHPCAILSYCRKRIEDPHGTSSQLALRRVGIHDPGVVPRVDQLRPANYDGAMSETSPNLKIATSPGCGGGLSPPKGSSRAKRVTPSK